MGDCTIALDDVAFKSEVSGRAQQRSQQIIRGTITASSDYAASGDGCDLAPYFPSQQMKYRVILNPVSNTGNRLGVYDHTNKKLWVFTALSTEAAGSSNQSANGIFSFIAIGE
jgi:hypothetical protein